MSYTTYGVNPIPGALVRAFNDAAYYISIIYLVRYLAGGRDEIFRIFSEPLILATQPVPVHSAHKNTEGAPRLAFQSLGLGVEVAFDLGWALFGHEAIER